MCGTGSEPSGEGVCVTARGLDGFLQAKRSQQERSQEVYWWTGPMACHGPRRCRVSNDAIRSSARHRDRPEAAQSFEKKQTLS
jgi:hypothetical protein